MHLFHIFILAWNFTCFGNFLCTSSGVIYCLQICMTYTTAECTVNNSWWCTEEMSETCKVSWQNKFVKLVHLFGFIINKFVTMHGHVNVKFDLYALAHLFQGESPGTHWIGLWVGISEWRKITCPTRYRKMIPRTSIPYPSHSTNRDIQAPDKKDLGYFHSS